MELADITGFFASKLGGIVKNRFPKMSPAMQRKLIEIGLEILEDKANAGLKYVVVTNSVDSLVITINKRAIEADLAK